MDIRSSIFIILNVAVGGTFGGNPTADTVFPQSMYVDYVRVYQKSTEVQPGTNTGDISSNGSIPGWDFNCLLYTSDAADE